jgi:hypothetical protein
LRGGLRKVKKGKRFFFEKKNQKTFGPAGLGASGAPFLRSASGLLDDPPFLSHEPTRAIRARSGVGVLLAKIPVFPDDWTT